MKLLQARVSERIKELLHKLAEIEGRSESEIVREAIVKLLRERGMIEDPKEGDYARKRK